MPGIRINLNGECLFVQDTKISYVQLVELANKRGHPSVTYSIHKGDLVRAGTLHAGSDPLHLEDGMTFTVIHTDRG